jgi:uncharacterized lipoprotein YddW (UPF0748 family)
MSTRRACTSLLLAGFSVVAALACGDDDAAAPDAGRDGGRDSGPARLDSGPRDSGSERDTGSPVDAGPDGGPDAGFDESGELRGIWITRFAYRTQADVEGLIDRAASGGFNAVFFQIRGEGDAYYRSTHEPWARRLSGTLGRDPGWDPLGVALARARMHGIELHAYFNAFSAWPAGMSIPDAEGPVQHALRAHPEWAAVDRSGSSDAPEYTWFTPGDPAYRAHVVATAEELLRNYDVDGLHLDRIRTPGPGYSYDDATRAAFMDARASDPSLTIDEFVPTYMVESVNAMVAELYAAIGRVRPRVKLSAAVWGIYERERLGDCSGGVSEGLDQYYQDSLAWMEAGTIDALVPMMYWPIEDGRCTDWRGLLDVFMEGRAGRHIWAGMHALDTTVDPDAWDFPAIEARIEHGRMVGAHGNVVFASAYVDTHDGYDDYAAGPFAEPASVPRMPWKPE